ncbi:MAG: FAD/NAD(P)-binding protein [Hyphomicrobiales bacterium]|nr:FAD/NAD(P)-binding protein [Hyphomicrobiales bacterium]
MAVAATTHPMLPQPYVVERVTRDLRDTASLYLKPHNDGMAAAFLPGQFNMLYAFGVGEVAISLSGDPADSGTMVHTIRSVGRVTETLTRLHGGDVVGVRGPFGSSWPIDAAIGQDVVIVAGGVGLAPLRPAIYAILAERSRFGRFVILYGARTHKDILYRRQLEQWSSRLDTYVDVTVDRASSDWYGNVGVVTKLIGHGGFDPDNTTAFVCGPETMMRFTVEAFAARGVDHSRMYVSLERNMRCAVGFCGHCQLGGQFVCRDGPVFRFDQIGNLIAIREL